MATARRAGTVLSVVVALVLVASAATTTTTVRKATTTTTTSPAQARQQQIDAQLTTLASQVEEASAAEADLLDRLDATAARRKALDGQLADLDTEISTTQADVDAASARFDEVSGDLQRAEAKFAATEVDLGGARAELADRAVRAYIHQPTAQVASVLLEQQSFRNLAAVGSFFRSYVDAQQHAVDRYLALRTDIGAERQSLQGLRDEVSAQRDLVTAHQEQLVAARQQQATARAAVATEEATQKSLVQEAKDRVKEFEGQIAALKKESDSIAALLRSRQGGQKVAPSGKGVLAAPVDGPITSTFGMRMHPIFHTMRMHTGVDFGGATGTPIHAAADGVVVVAGERGGYGNAVILDHGGALATLYAHQSRIAVTVGQQVSRGQVIGYIGSTGFATGPHLHFEVRVSGNPVDPMKYL